MEVSLMLLTALLESINCYKFKIFCRNLGHSWVIFGSLGLRLMGQWINTFDFDTYSDAFVADEVGENSFITVPAGRVRLGKPVNFPTYGWDCEYGETDME